MAIATSPALARAREEIRCHCRDRHLRNHLDRLPISHIRRLCTNSRRLLMPFEE
jgi:hypothetical protein